MSNFVNGIMDATGLLKELALLTRSCERLIIMQDKKFKDVIGTNDCRVL